MALQTEDTKYSFRVLEERRIHEYFDSLGVEGLRLLIESVQTDCAELERLAEAIDSGECYSVDPDAVRSWWGWG